MKTYRMFIKEGFRGTGLNPYSEARNSGLLVDAMNCSVTKRGLEGYIPDVKDLFSDDITLVDSVTHVAVTITKRWPFPQLFLTDVGLFIGAYEGLYYLNPRTPLMELYTYSTGSVTWPWSCAEINQRPMFTSGDVLVYYNDLSDAYVVKKYV